MSDSSGSGRMRAERPIFPQGYGIPETDEGLLPWSAAEERLVQARNYWIATVGPDGRPHAVPVWGVWVDGRLYFDGSSQTRRSRNIAGNPAVVAHLESGTEVVIVEGQVREIRAPEPSLAQRLAKAYATKYAADGYSPEPSQWDKGELYELRPTRAMAWLKFPVDCTRWTFGA